MAVRRLVLGGMLGVAVAWAGAARAEDPVVHTQPLKTEVFEDIVEDIVDGIGGVLGVLVGPPISSPSPYLNIPGALPEEPPAPVKVAAPPVIEPLPAAAPIVVPSPAATTPVFSTPLQPAPPPVAKAVATPPPPAPPPPRPAAAVVASSPPAASAVSTCAVRVAATATLEQMRRLPKCP